MLKQTSITFKDDKHNAYTLELVGDSWELRVNKLLVKGVSGYQTAYEALLHLARFGDLPDKPVKGYVCQEIKVDSIERLINYEQAFNKQTEAVPVYEDELSVNGFKVFVEHNGAYDMAKVYSWVAENCEDKQDWYFMSLT